MEDEATWEKCSENGLERSRGEVVATDNSLFGFGNGIYQSTDYGDNWSKISDFYVMDSSILPGSFIPFDEYLFAIDNSWKLFRSADSGKTFLQISDLTVRTMDVNSSGKLYLGTDAGIYASEDNGDNWAFMNMGPLASQPRISHIDINARDEMAILTEDSVYFYRIIPAPPNLSLSVSSLDFGEHLMGTTAKDTLTILNTGEADLIINNVNGKNGDFTWIGLPEIMPGNNSASVEVRFSPTAAGDRTGTIEFSSMTPIVVK